MKTYIVMTHSLGGIARTSLSRYGTLAIFMNAKITIYALKVLFLRNQNQLVGYPMGSGYIMPMFTLLVWSNSDIQWLVISVVRIDYYIEYVQ